MRFTPSGIPTNSSSLGVLGYLIIVNKQVHSYQLNILTDYLCALDLNIEDTVIADIIDGKDSSVSLAFSLETFESESEQIQKDLYYVLVALSSVDNAIDENEQTLMDRIISLSKINEEDADNIRSAALEDAGEIRFSQNHLFEKPLSAPTAEKGENIFFRIIHWITNFFKKLFGKESAPRISSGVDNRGDIDYKSAIEQCATVAAEDFKIVRPSYSTVIDKGTECIEKLKKYKLSLSLEIGLSAEVANIVKVFVDALNDNVLTQSRLAEESLIQKERTIPDFTISLIGRTKAGKSTLHAILTNQGSDKIGAGKQRTTRYNRVYQWNLLRLIDTPGIGSPEADGRSDDEIAESVLGESDIICFVIVDDSILKDILEFIEKVAALNKPIIILLNHKENITHDVKFRRYIEKPTDWLTSEGESNLAGHIHRIQKYADDNGFGSLVKVFPVFLLAAQMAGDEKHLEYSELLWNSSNMDSFINQLKQWIAYSGNIKRSQTILDEAAHIFGRSMGQISIAQKSVKKQLESLTQQRSAKIETLKKAEEESLANIKSVLKEKFDNLAKNEALNFAEEVYDKNGDISDYWGGYIQKIGFEDDVKTAVGAELSTYQKKADDTIRELFEDFYYSIKTAFDLESIDVPLQFDFKSITRLIGSALGVAGTVVTIILGVSNPVGWILTGGGILVGLGSLLFSSKEKRRQKSIDKIYNSIRDGILEQAPEQIKKTVYELQKELDKNTERIDRPFADLISGLSETVNLSDQLTACYDGEIQRINKVYAWRIIQFLNGRKEPYSSEAVNRMVRRVDRSQNGVMRIECSETKLNVAALDGVIADKVIIG